MRQTPFTASAHFQLHLLYLPFGLVPANAVFILTQVVPVWRCTLRVTLLPTRLRGVAVHVAETTRPSLTARAGEPGATPLERAAPGAKARCAG